jgi:hypothetical protein
MFDFWFELPPILRAGLGILLMVIAGVIWFVSEGTVYALGLGAVGLVFVLFAKSGDSGGYNF